MCRGRWYSHAHPHARSISELPNPATDERSALSGALWHESHSPLLSLHLHSQLLHRSASLRVQVSHTSSDASQLFLVPLYGSRMCGIAGLSYPVTRPLILRGASPAPHTSPFSSIAPQVVSPIRGQPTRHKLTPPFRPHIYVQTLSLSPTHLFYLVTLTLSYTRLCVPPRPLSSSSPPAPQHDTHTTRPAQPRSQPCRARPS